MHFFEKQRVGLIGQTSVSLQKILIFFMICNLFTFFHGGFLQFFLCLIGFIGAYRKKTCLLSIYFWVNIAIILFSLVSVVLVLGSAAQSNDQWASSSSWSSSSSAQAEPLYANQRWNHHPITATAHKIASWATEYSSESPDSEDAYSASASASASDSTSTYSSSETILISEDSYSYQPEPQPEPAVYENNSVPTIVIIIALVLTFIFAYLQAKALALAWRLRKLLLLPSIPVLNEPVSTTPPTTTAGEQVHYFPTQENNSCAEPQPEQIQQPVVAQPQPYPYYPYPYPQSYGVPQGMMMVPHQPTYWGQPPVFYSYAPQQPAQPNGEKQ